jgi:hypothetical protein
MVECFPEGKYTGILYLENSIHEYSFVRGLYRDILPYEMYTGIFFHNKIYGNIFP